MWLKINAHNYNAYFFSPSLCIYNFYGLFHTKYQKIKAGYPSAYICFYVFKTKKDKMQAGRWKYRKRIIV